MTDSFIPTKAALLKTNAAKDFKVVTYESYKAKPKNESPSLVSVGAGGKKDEDKRKGIDIQRARREIIKFGISGFTHQKQQEAKVALAVSLGAKPAKKECKNYKELVEQRKRQKRLDQKYAAMHLGKSSHSVGTSKQKMVFYKTMKLAGEKRKKKDDPLQIYGRPTLDTGSTKTSSTTRFPKKKSNNFKKKRS